MPPFILTPWGCLSKAESCFDRSSLQGLACGNEGSGCGESETFAAGSVSNFINSVRSILSSVCRCYSSEMD